MSPPQPPKTILVAPLNWGLGHATRCIPIIQALINASYNVILGSDGDALQLLQHEFPELPTIELPSYNISYTKTGSLLRLKLLANAPHAWKTKKKEERIVETLVAQNKIHGLISDNRFGVFNKDIPSVYLTHQLNVLSGLTTNISSTLHQKIIAKFDACWVPDVADPINLSGKLGHPQNTKFPLTYIGPLSRLSPKNIPKKYDILCLLSGPEPQRSILETKLKKELKNSEKRVALVRGKVAGEMSRKEEHGIVIYNYLSAAPLEMLINESELIIARSGYTTLMDVAILGKPAFLIPTPGQFEQGYLAKRLKEQGLLPSCTQKNFNVRQLRKQAVYKGMPSFEQQTDFSALFRLFEGKRKL